MVGDEKHYHLSDRSTMQADGCDVLQVEIRLLDGFGQPALDETVHGQTLGDLRLLGLENGRPDDLTPYSEGCRLTREGTLTAYLRAGEMGGKALIHLWTESGLETDLRIQLKK